ncbi:helix-turn-helix domain-containing protein [Companilactobacillus zhongbaensis]|uniref:helix-turn-helix domain-containing protein n=1 Tax=Companilactobacillus zhongbaensis TaxID=2486009 RepID=UPI000F78F0E3|nr:helix-turn-helix domain-containing protein [Companilactobacillus zhongbaensis]
MAEFRRKARKFDFEQRVEIVEWVIQHDKDYRAAAEKFKASYQQVNNWTRKYLKDGVDGLKDRRGQNKPVDPNDEEQALKIERKKYKELSYHVEISNRFLEKFRNSVSTDLSHHRNQGEYIAIKQIKDEDPQVPIDLLVKIAGVSSSAYYDWLKWQPNENDRLNMNIYNLLKQNFAQEIWADNIPYKNVFRIFSRVFAGRLS